MAEQATEQAVIRAPVERCAEIVSDVERYPEWVPDVEEVDVLERDERGRPTRVAFKAGAFGRSTSYTLVYDHSAAPGRISWHQVQGDVTRQLDGTYHFDPVEEGTQVTYHLLVDLQVPVPGFLKRRAEGRIITSALQELKARAEA